MLLLRIVAVAETLIFGDFRPTGFSPCPKSSIHRQVVDHGARYEGDTGIRTNKQLI